MSDKNEVLDLATAEALPTGQWVQDAEGRYACLMITHLGWPQRMWGFKADGGTKGRMVYHCSLDRISFPLHLADADTDECPHRLTNECGQCEHCGLVGVGEARPIFLSPFATSAGES